MGRLIDGSWSTHDLGTNERGEFVRRAAKFRNRVTRDGSSGFAPALGRYHLYVSYACGWSHRALIARHLKGLGEAVSVSFAEPFMGEEGWTFASGADELFGSDRVYEIYLRAQKDYTGRASVPVLWDRAGDTIVSNESIDIAWSFDREFGELADSSVQLFPEGQEDAIDSMIEANYSTVQNGVYACGFAASQEAYDIAARVVFNRMGELEELLGHQRYLLGDRITAADWYLFPTLYRFDSIYYVHFKCCYRQLRDYPNLWAYTRELYQVPRISETCSMEQVRRHYFTSHESIHPRRYIPLGPEVDFMEPHGREKKVPS